MTKHMLSEFELFGIDFETFQETDFSKLANSFDPMEMETVENEYKQLGRVIQKVMELDSLVRTSNNRHWRDHACLYKELANRSSIESIPYPLFQILYRGLPEPLT
jgi:hypothetical protein